MDFQCNGIPVLPGALEGIEGLSSVAEVVAYITARPVSTVEGTRAWLKTNGFPDLPILARPPSVPKAEANKWKGAALKLLYPLISGIVDDNKGLLDGCGADYKGTVFLLGHGQATAPGIACPSWPSVVTAAVELYSSCHDPPTPARLQPLCGSTAEGARPAGPDPGRDPRARQHGGEGVPP